MTLLATCRLALQINSSTFGTLLSSQGSSAHLNSASRLAGGQPGKTYPVELAPSNRFRLLRPPARPSHRADSEPVEALANDLGSGDGCWGLSLRGWPPYLSALCPAAPRRHAQL